MKAAVLLRTVKDVPWMPAPNVFETWSSNIVPPDALTTAAFVIVRKGDSFLFTKYNDDPGSGRQYDLPGGHREPGESINDAAVREAFEEACVRVRVVRPLGYYRCFVESERPVATKYPYPESFMAIVLCELDAEEPFVAEHETIGREYFTIAELEARGWRKDHIDLLRGASADVR